MKEVYDNGEKLAEYRHTPGGMLLSQRHGPLQVSYGYDRDKNLTALKALIYEYDGFNRAVKAETFDGNIQVNRYDVEGLRYELEENGRLVQFIFHQSEVITEQNETDTIRLIRGYDLIASDAQSARTYYHYASDEVGSTTHIVDEKGKVLNRYVYDAFGDITEQEETVPNRFKFNGQQFDPITQQYYLRARFYNPVVARFTQEDVYRGDGLNLYAYCRNNPVIYTDPSGYASFGTCNGAAAQMDAQRTGNNGQLALPAPDPLLALPAPSTSTEGNTAIPLPPAPPDLKTGRGYGAGDPPVRVEGTMSPRDMQSALHGHAPRGLGQPDVHHGGQMPGGPLHEIPQPVSPNHRNNPVLHPNKYNQGVTPEMRASDRELHWWYRAREQGADQLFPNDIYDN